MSNAQTPVKVLSRKEAEAMRARLSDVECRLFEINGFLNVLHRAVDCDRDNDMGDQHHGYPLLVKTVKELIEGIAQETQDMQNDLYQATKLGDPPPSNRGSAR